MMIMAGKEIEKQVVKTIREYSLINSADKVLVALSGGPDSVALLHLLHKLRKELKISICAVYINHHLRPRSAQKEARFCEVLCRKLSVPYFYEEINIRLLAEREKTGIEETARKYRYEILNMLADREKCHKIAAGHHRDDRVETILFNLFRGSGRAGLIGMPPSRERVIRPLFDLSREMIIKYLRSGRITYLTDQSNLSGQFTRNRIRNILLPQIENMVAGRAAENIIRFSEILADEESHLCRQVERTFRKAASNTPGGKIKLDLEQFFRYAIWLKRRLILRLLEKAGLSEVGFADIERVVALADGRPNSRLSVGKGLLAEKYGDGLYVYPQGSKIAENKVELPGKIWLDYPRIWIKLEYVSEFRVEEVKSGLDDKAYIDADQISPPLYLAGLKPGTRFHPCGRSGSKKAGDFLTDRKYPRPLRDELPVLYDRKGIIWLAGIEIDDRVKIRKETKKMVQLKIGRYRIKSKTV